MSTKLRIAGGLAALLVAAGLAGEAKAADTLSFGEQGSTATFGANAIVRIDGTISFANDCPDPGIDDFVYPATDVYIVPAGFAGGELEDAAGGRPNTIVSGASLFVDEVIAVTAPAGSLDEGVYDVVYDTCQDGQFDEGKDTIFENAVTVALPDVLPLADAAIRELKDEARSEYESWLATRVAMKGIFTLADRALKVQCKAGNAVGCAMKQVDYFGGVKERFLALLLSQSNHYLAIAEDPPNDDFERTTRVAPISFPRDHSDSALGNATADALGPIAGEAAVAAAFLESVERYQGAQAAGKREWALVHARQARNLASTLRQIVLATGEKLDRLESTVSATAGDLDAQLSRGRDFSRRVWHTGFTPAERRALLNQGLGSGAISALETELRADAFTESSGVDTAAVLAAIDGARAAHTDTAAAAAASATKWADIVASLESEDAPDAGPAIAAGGPYTAGEGGYFALQGSAAGAIDEAAWDLDGDGAFDDASGLEPSVAFPRAGAYVIGLRATHDGRESVSYAVVHVEDTHLAPVLSSPIPAARSATVVVGDERTFAIEATVPAGSPLAYAWTIDGAPAGSTAASLTFAPTAEQVGSHVIEVTVSDGTASGGTTRRAWDVVVLAVDGDGDGWTATTDCDEQDPAVYPTANELLGNGLDDDCDAATADAPPGGLTGSMWSWGSNHNGTVGTGSYSPILVQSPVQIPGYSDVVQIGGDDRSALAVLASGAVRTWGFNGSGELGNGTTAGSATPGSPLSVGGGPGHLSGITHASSKGSHVLARRADGSVVAWGENRDRQIGDGSTVNHRLFPMPVLTAAGGPPLAGVRAVEAGYVESYALMNDGSVRAWGQIRCDGGTSVRIEPYPVALPLVGGDVRQISSGNQFTLILKKDGTVLSCGANPPTSGRQPGINPLVPMAVTGLGAGSGVIDVAAGSESSAVLKQDGTVWMWGFNANWSLSAAGVPGGASVPAPIQVPLPPGPPVVDVEMTKACHVLALRADGSVLAWGCDFFGQVGDGEAPNGGGAMTPFVLDLQGATAYRVEASIWNSLVLARPAGDTEWERPATWVEASVEDATVAEGGGTFTVDLSAALPQDVTIEWAAVEGGTAGAADVALGSGTATVPAGAQSVEIAAPVLDDALDEDAETFTVVLQEASHGIRLERSQATVTIADDDDPPAINVTPATVTEGDTSLTDATLLVELSGPSGKSVEVAFATADGDATSPADYEGVSGTLAFAPGQQKAFVHVAVRGDSVVEPSETLMLALSEPENATLGEAAAALTIADDEPLALELSSPSVLEGDDAATPATFTVALEPAPPAGTTVSVDYHLGGVTANVPDDVAAASGTLVFAAGEGTKQVTVDVQGDLAVEPDEAFRLVLADPIASDGRAVLAGEGTLATIVNDDASEPTDTVPPITNAVAAPPPNDAGWNREDVTVTLTATDEGTGVEQIAYRLTGAQTGEDTVTGAQATVQLTADGITTVHYRATDKAGNVETERTLVVRIDRTAPAVSCTVSPSELWPPNHELIPVTVTVEIADGAAGSDGFTLAAVASNEPDDGTGDGATSPDIQGFDVGTSDTAGLLRAERNGNGSGRVYTLTYVGRDRASNQRTCTVTVTVPHDRR